MLVEYPDIQFSFTLPGCMPEIYSQIIAYLWETLSKHFPGTFDLYYYYSPEDGELVKACQPYASCYFPIVWKFEHIQILWLKMKCLDFENNYKTYFTGFLISGKAVEKNALYI